MLAYKFTKDALDDDQDQYMLQLTSIQDTMKSIREMELQDSSAVYSDKEM
jgi:hypothetical protein